MPPPTSIHHSSTSPSCAHAPAINNHKSVRVDNWHQMKNIMAAFHRRQGWQQCHDEVTSPPTSLPLSVSLSPTVFCFDVRYHLFNNMFVFFPASHFSPLLALLLLPHHCLPQPSLFVNPPFFFLHFVFQCL